VYAGEVLKRRGKVTISRRVHTTPERNCLKTSLLPKQFEHAVSKRSEIKTERLAALYQTPLLFCTAYKPSISDLKTVNSNAFRFLALFEIFLDLHEC
jgi:hypothetical protein